MALTLGDFPRKRGESIMVNTFGLIGAFHVTPWHSAPPFMIVENRDKVMIVAENSGLTHSTPTQQACLKRARALPEPCRFFWLQFTEEQAYEYGLNFLPFIRRSFSSRGGFKEGNLVLGAQESKPLCPSTYLHEGSAAFFCASKV